MKFIAPLLLAGSASAFAPSRNGATQSRTQLNLWGDAPMKDGENKEMSQAIPFVPRPKLLDGTLAGDVGFE